MGRIVLWAGILLAVAGGSATLAAMRSNTILQAQRVSSRAIFVAFAGLVCIIAALVKEIC